MGRVSRKCLGDGFYHIMEQGIKREFIFNSNIDKKKFLKLLFENVYDEHVKIYAFCVMDNHVHILIKCDNINVLSKRLHKVNTCYALYYNKMYNRVGYVFRDRYRAEPIYDYAHLVTCIKYIHNNPLKAGIVDDLKNYPFSSYNDYIEDRIKKDIIVEVFGDDPSYKGKIAGNTNECDFIDVDNEFGTPKFEDFNEACSDYMGLNFKDSNVVLQVSSQLRKRCGVEHSRIYKFMGISKSTYFEKIKIGLLRDVPESGKELSYGKR